MVCYWKIILLLLVVSCFLDFFHVSYNYVLISVYLMDHSSLLDLTFVEKIFVEKTLTCQWVEGSWLDGVR